MSSMKFSAIALLLIGASISAHAQQSATPQNKGEYLARAGDCVACHSVPGGKAFAGGLRMGTPMGAIYSTNITPDPETGIGRWSLEAFARAMHFFDRLGAHGKLESSDRQQLAAARRLRC